MMWGCDRLNLILKLRVRVVIVVQSLDRKIKALKMKIEMMKSKIELQ